MNEEAKKLFHGLLVSIWYQASAEELHGLIQEVIDRIDSDADWTDLGNIIYGTLICTYGDYGTSPRSGWFENEDAKKDALAILKEEKYNLEHYTDWGQEKFGFTGLEKEEQADESESIAQI